MRGDALVVGESLVDVVLSPEGAVEHPGGSAANTSVALARLGRAVRLATCLGADARATAIQAHLGASGVVLAGEPHVLDRTSSATARLGADGSASYTFDLDWRPGPLELGEAQVVHVGSIGAVLEPGCEDVVRLLESVPTEVLVSYDVNARPAITGSGADVLARVEQVAALARLVKASDEDLTVLYPDLSALAAARRLLALGPSAVAITRGADGASWVTADEVVEVPAVPVTVVDTIGAGDTFAAAMLDALWDDVNRDPHDVLAAAVRAAAVTASRAGADPPYRRELEQQG